MDLHYQILINFMYKQAKDLSLSVNTFVLFSSYIVHTRI